MPRLDGVAELVHRHYRLAGTWLCRKCGHLLQRRCPVSAAGLRRTAGSIVRDERGEQAASARWCRTLRNFRSVADEGSRQRFGQRKLTQYRAPLDKGADPAVVSQWITETQARGPLRWRAAALRQDMHQALGNDRLIGAMIEGLFGPEPTLDQRFAVHASAALGQGIQALSDAPEHVLRGVIERALHRIAEVR